MKAIISLLLFSLFISCGQRSVSRLSSAPAMESVYVVGTWGRDGSNGGIDDIVERLRRELAPFGVPGKNVYTQAWSKSRATDDLPGDVPATEKHVERLMSLSPNGASYLALIGHSFGGWAAARMSTSLPPSLPVSSVFLLDPVIMKGYRDRSNESGVKSSYGINFYQDQSIIDIDPCILGQIAETQIAIGNRCDLLGDFSCGQKFHGLSEGNWKVTYQRNSQGVDLKKSCDLIGRQKLRTSHTSIDDDAYLQETIVNKIVDDVRNLLGNSLPGFPFYGTRATSVADINADGMPDLVVVNDSQAVVKYNLGRGRFGPHKTILNEPFYGTRFTGFADLNGDKLDDFVVVNEDEIVVRYNDGIESFGPSQRIYSQPFYGSRATTFADLNGDGYDDAVVVNDSEIVVKYNDRKGGLGPHTVVSNYPYYGTKVTEFGDVNGDGFDDAIVVNDSEIVARMNDQKGGFGPHVILSEIPYYGEKATVFADMNNDGWDDAIVFNEKEQVVRNNLNSDGLGPNIKLILTPN